MEEIENQKVLLGLTIDTGKIKNQRIGEAIQRLNGMKRNYRYKACPGVGP